MPAAKSTKAYVVQRVNWKYNDEFYYRGGGEGDDQLVKAFRNRVLAEAHLRKLLNAELECLDGVNPFEFGHGRSLAAVTSMTPAELVKAVQALGLQPPDASRDIDDFGAWYEWYHGPGEESAAVWPLLDRLRLFEIIEIDVHG